MSKQKEFRANREKVGLELIKLAAASIAGPAAIVWFFGYYTTGAVAFIGVLYLIYPRLARHTRLLTTDAGLILDEDGVYDRTLSLGRIPWSQIQDAEQIEAENGHHMIELTLSNEEEFKKEFIQRTLLYRPIRRRNIKSGRVGFWIYPQRLIAEPDQIVQAIQNRTEESS